MGDIFRAEFPGYARARGLRGVVRQGGWAIMACRTAALGGHAEYCPAGHFVECHYNSCRHRACPQCHGLETERWLRRQMSRYALNCGYHHVIFTVPQELTRVWQYNRVLFSNLMFQAARDALLELLQDTKYLGALPGLVGNLHTWKRSGENHVHQHFLVTAGGWTPEGWKSCADDYFVPYNCLRELFRDKLVCSLHRALKRDELVVPSVMCGQLVTMLKDVGAREWHVKVMERYEGGQGVLTYFSRYVRGGPISNPQILSYARGVVTYRYRDRETGADRQVEQSAWAFMDRILEHVPEKGFRTVRYYGLFAPTRRAALVQCRGWLGMTAYEEAVKLTLAAYLEQLEIEPVTQCPRCGQRLKCQELPRAVAHAPPREKGYHVAA